ncbi:protein telomere ends associated-like [Drosophila busckii]|uniref:protein telomere ends associated-like n=1 Tax=Drosophila busckii TaxID=30019 RepID=UPI001432F69B|nr:protein telomere ends associated-like [Drosophila busckii]
MDKSSKPPVTFEIFNKFIENLSDIAFQVKVCEVECRTKTTDECAKWYYEAFYNQPEVRKKYEYRLKSCPKAMRDKLLQIPESIDDKQIKAQGADGVELNLHGRGRFLFPVTFETFQQYVDQDKLLPYLLRKHFKDKTKRQAYISDAALCRKVLRKYYNTFYIYPNLRLTSKHDFLKVPDALRERLWLPGKPLDEMAQNAVANEDVSLQRQLHAQNSRSSITECHESQVDDDADAVDSETEDLVVVDKRVASNISNNVEMTETPKSSKTSTVDAVEARTEFAEKSIETLTVNTKQKPIGKSFGNIRNWLVTNKEHKRQGLGRYIFPVTFETFEQHVDKDKLLHYLVRKHIKEAKRQAYLSDESKGRKMLHRYYLTFYINPSHRLSSKHDYLRVPNALRENFLLPGKPLDELALITMDNQPVLERQPAAEIEAVSSTESNNWLPIVSSIVSFEVFEQHIKNLYEIVWQLKMNDPVYECKGFEDCAFAYYLAFYLKPEIRERYAFVLNPCTLAMKKRILALPNSVDIARLEQLQIKHPYLSISSQDETQQASETEAQAMELDDNEVDSQMANAEQQQNAVAISEPACSQGSDATLDASEIADIPMESAHSVQPAPQQSPLKSDNRIETNWPVESSAGKHIPMKSPHTVQPAPQQSTAASNERILKTVNGITYEFPVSLEAFKRYINYDSVIQELAHFRTGNKEKAAQILRDRARKIAIFKGYYNSFYIHAEKRNVCNYNFDAAPAESQVKLMQLAQPVKELTAPQMSQSVKELTAPTKQTVESPAELQELPTPENPTTETVTKETEQRKSTSSIQYPVSFVLFQKIVFLDEIVAKMQKQAQYSQLDALQCQRVFYHNFYTQPKIRQEYEIVLRPCPAFVEDLLFKVPLVQNVMENAKKRKDIRLFKPYNLAAYIALTKDAHRRQLLFKQFLSVNEQQQVERLTETGATSELGTTSGASNNAAAAAESASTATSNATAAMAATAIVAAVVQPNSNDATASLNPTLCAAAEASSNALRVSRPKGASCVNSTAQVPIISIINLNSMQDLKFRVLKDNANSKPTENSATDINARQICKPSSKATPNAKEKQLDPTISHDKTNISSLSAASSKATTGTKKAPVEPVASQTKTNATSLKPASSNSTTVPKKEPVTPITSQVKRITTAVRSNATSDAKEASVQSTATDAKATATSLTTMAKESPVEPNPTKVTPTEINSNINANQICQPSSNATTDAKDAPVEPVASQNKTNATSLNPASAKAKKSAEPITSQVKTNTTALSALRSNATSDAKEASVEPTTSQAKATATSSTTVATEAPATATTLAEQKLQLECVNFFAEASEEHNMRYLLRTSRGLMHSLWRILAHLSLADFRKYTSIQQAENIYEDEQVLSRCYEHVVGRGNWPLQLHVKLHLLQQLLHSNGVELDFTDLEELSPKVLHLDELLRFTNFYSIAEEDYWQRTGEEAPSVEAWFELGAKFYERCWQHNQWLRQVPVISTEHLKQLLSTVVPVEIREHEKLSALPACFNNLDDSSCPATQLDTSLPVTSFVDIDNVCPASQQQELIDDPLLANSEPLYIDLADPQAADPWLYVDQAEIIELPDEENSAEPLLLEIRESEEEPVCDQQQRDTVEVPAEPAAIELPAKQQIKQEPIKFLNDLRFSLPDNSNEEFNCELINTDEKIVNLADDDEEENKLACFRLASTQPQANVANSHSQEHSYERLMANIAQLEDASTAAPALIRKRPLAAAVTQVRKKARLMSDNVPQLTHGFRALPMTAVARIQPSGTSVEVASSTAEQQKEEPPAQESALTPSQAFAQDDTLMGSSQLAAPFVTQRKRRP